MSGICVLRSKGWKGGRGVGGRWRREGKVELGARYSGVLSNQALLAQAQQPRQGVTLYLSNSTIGSRLRRRGSCMSSASAASRRAG